MHRCGLRTVSVALLLMSTSPFALVYASPISWPLGGAPRIASSERLFVGGSELQIDFASGDFDLPKSEIVKRVQKAAQAVALYYGRYPVPRERLLIIPLAGAEGVQHGTTWGDRDGFPAFTRMQIGEHSTVADLDADWILTHEMVHTALTSLPDEQHWLEEGLATYIEPIARAQNGELTPQRIWSDMAHGMPQGEPRPGDRGLDHTATWGRTYWGGALFCLVADVEIRRQTQNRRGLQDALQAVVRAGETINTELPIQQVLQTGDQATGTHVLSDMYRQWSNAPVTVDLDLLWTQLGVQQKDGNVTLDDHAPLAAIRSSITLGAQHTGHLTETRKQIN